MKTKHINIQLSTVDFVILMQSSSPLWRPSVRLFQTSSLKFRTETGVSQGLEPGPSRFISCALTSEPPALLRLGLCASPALVYLCLRLPDPLGCCVHRVTVFSCECLSLLLLLMSWPHPEAGALLPPLLHRRLCYLLVEAAKCSPSVSDDQSMTRPLTGHCRSAGNLNFLCSAHTGASALLT